MFLCWTIETKKWDAGAGVPEERLWVGIFSSFASALIVLCRVSSQPLLRSPAPLSRRSGYFLRGIGPLPRDPLTNRHCVASGSSESM